jgi:hypothetical protein
VCTSAKVSTTPSMTLLATARVGLDAREVAALVEREHLALHRHEGVEHALRVGQQVLPAAQLAADVGQRTPDVAGLQPVDLRGIAREAPDAQRGVQEDDAQGACCPAGSSCRPACRPSARSCSRARRSPSPAPR